MTIKLITLDLDNTLWENDQVIHHAEHACYQFLTRQVPDLASQHSVESLKQLRHQLATEQPYLAAQISKLRKLSIHRALQDAKVAEPDIQELVDQSFQCFLAERNKVTLFPETLPLLKALSKEYRLASLTNGNADLKQIGIASYFSFSLSAELVGANKPRPNIFHAALHKAGVAAKETLHIGDHPIDDIQGAAQLGIQTLWYNPGKLAWNPTHGKAPGLMVHSLSDIPEAIKNSG